MPMMLIGVFVGAGFIAATFWSVFQILRAGDSLRMAHSAAAVLSLFMMATFVTVHPMVSAVAGALLVGAAVFALIMERGFTRLFPLSQIAVGVAVAARLPIGM